MNYFELIIDKLKFKKHIDVLCKNVDIQTKVLYKFRNVFNIDTT